MDYFAEIADVPDAFEGVTRLQLHEDAPRHLLEGPLNQLHAKIPAIWRAELTNWFYHKPGFAALVWKELRYCRLHRERVARAAVILVELRPRTASFGEQATAETRQYLQQSVALIPYLRAAYVQAVAWQYQHTIRLVPSREQAIRDLANALKPAGPHSLQREPAHEFMDELAKAAEVTYNPPAFIANLLREIEAAAAARNQFTSMLISWRIGVNEFSMHHFYKNRLVRCYLGASRWQERKADWFTGFDSADDIRLNMFDRSTKEPQQFKYPGPYPIINAALNLVAGEDLAWQERKANSFTFTPKYCGYDVDRAVLTAEKGKASQDGYAPTSAYATGLGQMLGTAMAISGAAANPNMGKITTAASAFLMTIFNVRLGWWLPNPRRKERWKDPTPKLGVTYGVLELFGLTDDKKQFVNVSDGGHFENLGIYELIRRGCRFIIACDAGQDGSFGMEDLGNVIRKCRTDFGVEIDICIDRIRERDKHGWSKAHCVVGKIRYPGIAKHCEHGRVQLNDGLPAGEDGFLIYLKPSISGDEPYDILEYYTRVPEFPHETTADQWFNESQFESYRRLGLHIAETTFQRYREREDEAIYPPQLFDYLNKFWYPPIPKIADYSTEHASEYSRIMELIRSGNNLRFLDAALFKDLDVLDSSDSQRDEFYICNALIQLIENVYADLDLEENYAHPHVGGWMKVFIHWAKQPPFQRTWKQSGNTYAERFRRFYNDRLVNGPDR